MHSLHNIIPGFICLCLTNTHTHTYTYTYTHRCLLQISICTSLWVWCLGRDMSSTIPCGISFPLPPDCLIIGPNWRLCMIEWHRTPRLPNGMRPTMGRSESVVCCSCTGHTTYKKGSVRQYNPVTFFFFVIDMAQHTIKVSLSHNPNHSLSLSWSDTQLMLFRCVFPCIRILTRCTRYIRYSSHTLTYPGGK